MRPLRRLLACSLLLALVASGAALAGRGDPQKALNRADQARARAMLLKKVDLAPGARVVPSSTEEEDFYCKALDESDLTVTGEAETPSFERGPTFVQQTTQVYESVADANASRRRGTSTAGEQCARNEFRKYFAQRGVTLDSWARTPFPRFAQKSVAYRLVASNPAIGLRVVVDVVFLQQSRGQAAVLLGAAGSTPFPRAEGVRLARLVAGKMARAMRGA
jgi:hypothetical protein